MGAIQELAYRLTRDRVSYGLLENQELEPYSIFQNSLYIWTGASDKTVWGDPRLNWHLRAHHDTIHIEHRLRFTYEEEKRAAQIGIHKLGLLCSPTLADLYWTDTVGQQDYYYEHGKFPDDQRELFKGVL